MADTDKKEIRRKLSRIQREVNILKLPRNIQRSVRKANLRKQLTRLEKLAKAKQQSTRGASEQ